MPFFLAVKPSHALDRHVVALGGARCEDNIFGIGSKEICYMLRITVNWEEAPGVSEWSNLSGIVNGLLRFPTVSMCPAVWVAI
jgi:hypothetical protein